MLYILPSGEIDVRSSLGADFTVIRDMFVEYLVEAASTASGVFRLPLRALIALGEQRELLAGVYPLHSSIRQPRGIFSRLSINCGCILRICSHCNLRTVGPWRLSRWLAVNYPHLTRWLHCRGKAWPEPLCNWRRRGGSQDLEALLAELQRLLYGHSSLLSASHDIFRYKINQALHDYVRPRFDAVCKHTIDFCSASTNQVETHGVTLYQSALSIISCLDRHLSSSAAVSNSG